MGWWRWLPVDRITIIRPDMFIKTEGLPRRMTDRETLNEINSRNGHAVEHTLHGRSVKGEGVEIESFRGTTISGLMIASAIDAMLGPWMAELVKVKEKIYRSEGGTRAPKSKVQVKFRMPNADLTGMMDCESLYLFCEAICKTDLSIRGAYLNKKYDSEYLSLVLGPNLEGGSPANLIIQPGVTYVHAEYWTNGLLYPRLKTVDTANEDEKSSSV